MQKYERKFYIIFSKKKYNTWWNWVLDTDIYHCHIITQVKSNTLIIDITRGAIELYDKNGSVDVYADIYIRCGYKVIKAIANEDEMKIPKYKGFITCVSLIKLMLGINKWNIITAKQLYNYLQRRAKWEEYLAEANQLQFQQHQSKK